MASSYRRLWRIQYLSCKTLDSYLHVFQKLLRTAYGLFIKPGTRGMLLLTDQKRQLADKLIQAIGPASEPRQCNAPTGMHHPRV